MGLEPTTACLGSPSPQFPRADAKSSYLVRQLAPWQIVVIVAATRQLAYPYLPKTLQNSGGITPAPSQPPALARVGSRDVPPDRPTP